MSSIIDRVKSWSGWATVAGVLGALGTGLGALFIFHRRGVAEGQGRERERTGAANRSAIGDELDRAATRQLREEERSERVMDIHDEADRGHAEIEHELAERTDPEVTKADLERWDKQLADNDADLKRRGIK